MPGGLGKCCRIRHIVRLRQMLRRWRSKASSATRIAAVGSVSERIPSDVPAGYVAVCVGTSSRRFVVRATYLNYPVFRKLLNEAEEEYGFTNSGPLSIPCDELLFEEILRFVSRADSNSGRFVSLEDFKRCAYAGPAKDGWPESRPLLHGLADKSVW
ncbi:auxin-responsive protein SAUR50-like [Aristolochia californica]|uniref:auxin-responsive protein SAUR50-like n=1 Tax=Aristolochia californica TaxID=171875 RepID=UPI0035D887EE